MAWMIQNMPLTLAQSIYAFFHHELAISTVDILSTVEIAPFKDTRFYSKIQQIL
jgi:hypothetical protein